MIYDSESQADRAQLALAYDNILKPKEEPERWYIVKVTITREYEGSFFGTQQAAEESAIRNFKRHTQDFDEETISVESEEEGNVNG